MTAVQGPTEADELEIAQAPTGEAPTDTFPAETFPAETFPAETFAVGEMPAAEPVVLGGFVVGGVEGALATEAFPDVERPEDDEPETEREPHLRVAPVVKRGLRYRRRRAQLLVLGAAVLSAFSMFMLVTFHVFAAQSAFTLDKLDNKLAVEQQQYGILRDQVATLSSPEAIASGAQNLGMIRASEVTLLHPFAAPSFGSTSGLPVPPPTPYKAIDDTGQ